MNNVYEGRLGGGAHVVNNDNERKYSILCLMEAVAYIAGEPHSDHPACVSPALAAALRHFNDALLTDEERNTLLKPLIPSLIGTNSGTNSGNTNTNKESEINYLFLNFITRTINKFLPPRHTYHRLSEHIADLEAFYEMFRNMEMISTHYHSVDDGTLYPKINTIQTELCLLSATRAVFRYQAISTTLGRMFLNWLDRMMQRLPLSTFTPELIASAQADFLNTVTEATKL